MTKSCGVYLYFIYIWPINLHFYKIYFHHQCHIDMRCMGMNVKVRKMRNKDQVPREKP